MNRFGLTKERYDQMMMLYDYDEEWVKEIVNDWGAENCNKGYAIFDIDGRLHIERIDEVGCFNDDIEAKEQAIKDGVKIIPVEDLPENFDLKELGWIDTEENKKRIAEFCKGYWDYI